MLKWWLPVVAGSAIGPIELALSVPRRGLPEGHQVEDYATAAVFTLVE